MAVKNKIVFRLLKHPFKQVKYDVEIKKGKDVFLSAFNEINKDNGFF